MASAVERRAAEQALQAIAAANGGRITATMVVSAASDPASPLHSYFSWDDREAAIDHRLNQARALIRSVCVVFRVEQKEVKAPFFLRDPEADCREQGYVSLPRLRTAEDAAREAVVREFAAAAAALRRARVIASALSIDAEVEALQNQIAGLHARLHADTPEDRRGAA